MHNKNNSLFPMLVFLTCLNQVSIDIYLPSLPYIANDLQSPIAYTQWSIALFALSAAAAQLIYGPVSDAIGRRKPLLFGLLLFIAASLVCVNAQDIETLLLGRALQGLGVGACSVLSRAIMRDTFSGDEFARYASYMAIAVVGILAVAPMFGGCLQHYFSWHAPFVALFIYAVFIFLCTYFMTAESHPQENRNKLSMKVLLSNFAMFCQHPVFLRYNIISMMGYAAILAWLTAGSVILQEEMGFTVMQYSWVCVLSGACFALGAYLNASYVIRMGAVNMLSFGLCGLTCAGLLMLLSYLLGLMHPMAIIVPAMLMLFSVALIFPNTFSEGIKPFAATAGMASALFESSRILAGFAGSALIASTTLPMGAIVFVSGLIAWLVFFLTREACCQYVV